MTAAGIRHDGPSAKILIVDDHAAVRLGVRTALSVHPQWEICGEAVNGREAIEKVQELKPDVVILDVSMPILNGIEAAREIRRLAPSIKILILTMHDAPQLNDVARQSGANSVVIKSEATSHLVKEISRLLDERKPNSP